MIPFRVIQKVDGKPKAFNVINITNDNTVILAEVVNGEMIRTSIDILISNYKYIGPMILKMDQPMVIQ